MFERLRSFVDAIRPLPQTVRPRAVPLAEVETVARTMKHQRVWTCVCGASIKIRCRSDRFDGPSNFRPFPPGHTKAGQSRLDSDLLSWNGLLEERGWTSDPVRCPACQRGLTVLEYKTVRRELASLREMHTVLIGAGATSQAQELATTIEHLRRRVEA